MFEISRDRYSTQNMSDDNKTIPSQEELVDAIQKVKISFPEYGIKKVTSQVTEDQPSWSVSEKRVKKLMQTQGLTNTAQPAKSGMADDPSIPVSFIDPKLDLKSVSTNVVVTYLKLFLSFFSFCKILTFCLHRRKKKIIYHILG